MHEIGVLNEIVKTVKKYAEDNDVKEIHVVTIQVGELSGYLTEFFEEYFPMLTEGDPLFKDAKLKIITTKGEGLCNDCHALYNIMANKGKCPRCGSRNKTVLGGQELLLKEIIC